MDIITISTYMDIVYKYYCRLSNQYHNAKFKKSINTILNLIEDPRGYFLHIFFIL